MVIRGCLTNLNLNVVNVKKTTGLTFKIEGTTLGHDVNVLRNLKLIWNTLKAFLNEFKDRSIHRHVFHQKGVFQKVRMYSCSLFVVEIL